MRAFFFLLFVASFTAQGQIFIDTVKLDTARITDNLTSPWDVEWLADDTLLVTQLGGDIYLVDAAAQTKQLVYSVPDIAQETQSGLMGLAVHPDYPNTNKIYIASTHYDVGFNLLFRVEELSYNATTNQLQNPVAIIDNIASAQSNTGGRILISSDLKLWVTLGELDQTSQAQDPNTEHGKILRYNLDGTIPGDNPVAGNPLFTLGHRNPQGVCEGQNGTIYTSEHGAFVNDEVNRLIPGRNYGWPLASGPCNAANQSICDQLNMVEPLDFWTPNIGPAGIVYYDNPAVPILQNTLLMAALPGKAIVRMKLNTAGDAIDETQVHGTEWIGRIRDLAISPTGRLFCITSNTDLFGTPTADDDKLYELIPSAHDVSVGESNPDPGIALRQGNRQVVLDHLSWKRPVWTLMDIQGRTVATGIAEGDRHQIGMEQLPVGVYVLHLSHPEYDWTRKVVLWE